MTLETTQQTSYAERRAAMADETRTRILDACVAILARGVAELSIPAVAREAGVSVPTVYRNFADKKKLVHETAMHLRQMRGGVAGDRYFPETLAELPDAIRTQFQQSSTIAETVRAALSSETITAARREAGEFQRRITRMEPLLADALRGMTDRDRDFTLRVTTVLCSSATLRAFREVAGNTPEEAAEAVAWMIGRLIGRDLRDASVTSTTPSSPTQASAKARKSPSKKKASKR